MKIFFVGEGVGGGVGGGGGGGEKVGFRPKENMYSSSVLMLSIKFQFLAQVVSRFRRNKRSNLQVRCTTLPMFYRNHLNIDPK